MLVEFRVKNYRSIGEEQVFSMVAGGGDENPQNVSGPVGRMKQGLLRSAVLYGANASGKSNLLRALLAMRSLVLNSVEHKPGDELKAIVPFLFDKELSAAPTEFDLTFLYDKVRYQYGFSANRQSIQEEWLYAYPKGQPQLLFRRTDTKGRGKHIFTFGANFTGDKKAIADRTISNVLFLTKGASENHPRLNDLLTWFRESLQVETMFNRSSELVASTAMKIDESAETLAWVQRLLQDADFGISEIRTEMQPVTSSMMFQRFPKEMQAQMAETFKDHKVVEVRSVHRVSPGTTLNFDEESEGTQKYFGVLGPLYRVLKTGGTLVVDELDSSLHPLLIQRIVELFHDPAMNTSDAQLIFSTHDTNLLKPEIFRRDQVWFVEKDEREQSQYYSLLEYTTGDGTKPRKDEAWERGYLAGRYGAIPFLGRFHF